MANLPQLVEADLDRIEAQLDHLLAHTEATTALVIDQGGFLVTHRGESGQFDLTTIAALAAGAFMANQTIAGLVHETNFNSVYQQGEQFSMFVTGIDADCLVVVIFKAQVNVGLVKYYAAPTVEQIARQLQTARQRSPNTFLDLSEINLADTSSLFRRKD